MATLTLANQLTLLRMFLIPALVLLVIYGYSGWGFVTFALAGVTDALDGLVARRSGQKTSLGALLDPMADKLLLISTFVVLTLPNIDLVNRIPVWLTVLVISRDIVIVLTVAVVYLAVGRRTFYPSAYGKAATGVYIFAGAIILFFNYLERTSVLVDIGIWASLVLTLVSGFHYIAHAARAVNESPGTADR